MKFRPPICLLGFFLVLVNITHVGICGTQRNQEQSNSKYPSDISPFIQQADELFAKFDKDKNQRLDKVEFDSIDNRPNGADADRDGFVDKVELIKALILSKGESKPAQQKPSTIIERPNNSEASSNTEPSIPKAKKTSDVYDRYADGLFKNYDLNKDEKLDQTEMKAMRRPPLNADENSDGYVDRDELIAFVARRVSQPKQPPRNAEGDKLEALLLKKIEERKRALAAKKTNSQNSVIPQKQKTQKQVNDFRNNVTQLRNTSDRLQSLRIKQRDVLKRMTEMLIRQYETGSASLEDIFKAQSKLLEADLRLATNQSQRIQILTKHVETKRKFFDLTKKLANEGLVAGVKVLSAEAELLNAEIKLTEEQNRSAVKNQP